MGLACMQGSLIPGQRVEVELVMLATSTLKLRPAGGWQPAPILTPRMVAMFEASNGGFTPCRVRACRGCLALSAFRLSTPYKYAVAPWLRFTLCAGLLGTPAAHAHAGAQQNPGRCMPSGEKRKEGETERPPTYT